MVDAFSVPLLTSQFICVPNLGGHANKSTGAFDKFERDLLTDASVIRAAQESYMLRVLFDHFFRECCGGKPDHLRDCTQCQRFAAQVTFLAPTRSLLDPSWVDNLNSSLRSRCADFELRLPTTYHFERDDLVSMNDAELIDQLGLLPAHSTSSSRTRDTVWRDARLKALVSAFVCDYIARKFDLGIAWGSHKGKGSPARSPRSGSSPVGSSPAGSFSSSPSSSSSGSSSSSVGLPATIESLLRLITRSRLIDDCIEEVVLELASVDAEKTESDSDDSTDSDFSGSSDSDGSGAHGRGAAAATCADKLGGDGITDLAAEVVWRFFFVPEQQARAEDDGDADGTNAGVLDMLAEPTGPAVDSRSPAIAASSSSRSSASLSSSSRSSSSSSSTSYGQSAKSAAKATGVAAREARTARRQQSPAQPANTSVRASTGAAKRKEPPKKRSKPAPLPGTASASSSSSSSSSSLFGTGHRTKAAATPESSLSASASASAMMAASTSGSSMTSTSQLDVSNADAVAAAAAQNRARIKSLSVINRDNPLFSGSLLQCYTLLNGFDVYQRPQGDTTRLPLDFEGADSDKVRGKATVNADTLDGVRRQFLVPLQVDCSDQAAQDRQQELALALLVGFMVERQVLDRFGPLSATINAERLQIKYGGLMRPCQCAKVLCVCAERYPFDHLLDRSDQDLVRAGLMQYLLVFMKGLCDPRGWAYKPDEIMHHLELIDFADLWSFVPSSEQNVHVDGPNCFQALFCRFMPPGHTKVQSTRFSAGPSKIIDFDQWLAFMNSGPWWDVGQEVDQRAAFQSQRSYLDAHIAGVAITPPIELIATTVAAHRDGWKIGQGSCHSSLGHGAPANGVLEALPGAVNQELELALADECALEATDVNHAMRLTTELLRKMLDEEGVSPPASKKDAERGGTWWLSFRSKLKVLGKRLAASRRGQLRCMLFIQAAFPTKEFEVGGEDKQWHPVAAIERTNSSLAIANGCLSNYVWRPWDFLKLDSPDRKVEKCADKCMQELRNNAIRFNWLPGMLVPRVYMDTKKAQALISAIQERRSAVLDELAASEAKSASAAVNWLQMETTDANLALLRGDASASGELKLVLHTWHAGDAEMTDSAAPRDDGGDGDDEDEDDDDDDDDHNNDDDNDDGDDRTTLVDRNVSTSAVPRAAAPLTSFIDRGQYGGSRHIEWDAELTHPMPDLHSHRGSGASSSSSSSSSSGGGLSSRLHATAYESDVGGYYSDDWTQRSKSLGGGRLRRGSSPSATTAGRADALAYRGHVAAPQQFHALLPPCIVATAGRLVPPIDDFSPITASPSQILQY